MPSNAMKITQLITRLSEILETQGDLDVVVPNQAADTVFAVQQAVVTPQAGWPWKTMIRPVLAIEPTDVYAATPEPDTGWRYDLMGAPEGVDVTVMKRRGGEDVGQRNGDFWSVYENGNKLWTIAPGGIMAWRLPA